MTINGKIAVFGAQMKEFTISRGILWQSDDYYSEGHFALTYQIWCDSNSKAHDFYWCLFASCDDFRQVWESRKVMAVCSSSSQMLNSSSTTLSLAFNVRGFPEHLSLLAAASTNSFCGDIPTRQRWFRGNTQTLKKKKRNEVGNL